MVVISFSTSKDNRKTKKIKMYPVNPVWWNLKGRDLMFLKKAIRLKSQFGKLDQSNNSFETGKIELDTF